MWLLKFTVCCIGGVSATYDLITSSSILKGEIAFIKQLQKWLGEKCKWNLCYRASRDGWSANDFHKHCDNKGSTVVLMKALLHLLPTSSKVRSSVQSSVSLVMDHTLVEVLICSFVTILKLSNHTANLETHINFPLVMSKTVNKQRTFLLVSTNS